jgi:hypothetical protein
MASRLPTLVLTLLFFCVAPLASAEPGRVNPEATEMAAELIGAPVFAKDGIEVGEVADIAFDEILEPQRLRMTTGAALGLGARTLEVPKDAFMPLRVAGSCCPRGAGGGSGGVSRSDRTRRGEVIAGAQRRLTLGVLSWTTRPISSTSFPPGNGVGTPSGGHAG